MSIFSHGMATQANFYPYILDYSCQFVPADNTILYRTIGASPTDEKKATFSTWLKRSGVGTFQNVFNEYSSATDQAWFQFPDSNELRMYNLVGASSKCDVDTTNTITSTSDWYHVLFIVDTAQGSSVNRVKIYFDNVLETLSVVSTPVLNSVFRFLEGTNTLRIGNISVGGARPFDGYLCETHFIDGQALTPSNFGVSKDGSWIPKKYIGTYGNEGFYLDYSDASNLGTDQSGNGNDLTESGFVVGHRSTDSPTN